jgi:hypothetical protein
VRRIDVGGRDVATRRRANLGSTPLGLFHGRTRGSAIKVTSSVIRAT